MFQCCIDMFVVDYCTRADANYIHSILVTVHVMDCSSMLLQQLIKYNIITSYICI